MCGSLTLIIQTEWITVHDNKQSSYYLQVTGAPLTHIPNLFIWKQATIQSKMYKNYLKLLDITYLISKHDCLGHMCLCIKLQSL